MATQIVSDISGQHPASTYSVHDMEGNEVTIDLTEDEWSEFKRKHQELYQHAKRPARKRKMYNTTPYQRTVIRNWALNNGHNIALKGQIPNEVIEDYLEAHHKLP